jgi:hypothetical protein
MFDHQFCSLVRIRFEAPFPFECVFKLLEEEFGYFLTSCRREGRTEYGEDPRGNKVVTNGNCLLSNLWDICLNHKSGVAGKECFVICRIPHTMWEVMAVIQAFKVP